MSSWFESVTEKLIHCRVEGLFQKRFRRSSQTTTEREQHGTPLKNQQGWKSVGCVGLILIIIWHRFVSMMEVWIIYIYIYKFGTTISLWCFLMSSFPLLHLYFASAPPTQPMDQRHQFEQMIWWRTLQQLLGREHHTCRSSPRSPVQIKKH